MKESGQMVPEYSVETSEKIYLQQDLLKISHQNYKVQVQEKSRRLYTEVSTLVDTSREILDLLRELEQLREDTV